MVIFIQHTSWNDPNHKQQSKLNNTRNDILLLLCTKNIYFIESNIHILYTLTHECDFFIGKGTSIWCTRTFECMTAEKYDTITMFTFILNHYSFAFSIIYYFHFDKSNPSHRSNSSNKKSNQNDYILMNLLMPGDSFWFLFLLFVSKNFRVAVW